MGEPLNNFEMTKLCAEAMGLKLLPANPHTVEHGGIHYHGLMMSVSEQCLFIQSGAYNPLADDAQAMALVKKHGLTLDPRDDVPPFAFWRAAVVPLDGNWEKQIYAEGADLNRVIVECVAKLQATR